MIKVETSRVRLYPATQKQMEACIACETDRELKEAYSEMLENSLRNPDSWEWYAMWNVERQDGMRGGDLCFKGLDANGVTESGYGILEEHQGKGYATEAVKAVTAWAFENPAVIVVEAETDPGNRASQRVLEKCGFIANGVIGKEGPRFTLTR